MGCQSRILSLLIAVIPLVSSLMAEDSAPAPDVLKGAIEKSIPLLEKGTKGSADNRKCFTCHSQAVPMMALAEANKRGFAIDDENFKRQMAHTLAHLKRSKSNYLQGRSTGGSIFTAGYLLWALEAGEQEANELTTATTHYLLEHQKDASHWSQTSSRPPTQGSDFTASYISLRGLLQFGTDEEQQEQIEARAETVGKWLLGAKVADNEDRVFRLWSLPYVDESEEAIAKATADLIDSQRADGGWAQKDDMQSDAYATATALVVLLRTDSASTDDAAVRRGLRYLLSTQKDDGSWHVVTRAKPIQTYFESGFPHGKDQFISVSASSWATLALTLSLPDSP